MIDFRDYTSLHITNADVAAVVDEVLIKVIPLMNVIQYTSFSNTSAI